MILRKTNPEVEDLSLGEIETVFINACQINIYHSYVHNPDMILHLIDSIENGFESRELNFNNGKTAKLFISVLKFVKSGKFNKQQKESFRTKLAKHMRNFSFLMKEVSFIKLNEQYYLLYKTRYNGVFKHNKNNFEYYSFYYPERSAPDIVEYHKKWIDVNRYDPQLKLYQNCRKGLMAIDLLNIILHINSFEFNNDIKQYIKEYIKLFFDLKYLENITFK